MLYLPAIRRFCGPFLLLPFLFLPGCKKDDTKPENFRLTERRYYEYNILTLSNSFHYTGNKMDFKRDFYHSDDDIDSLKGIVEYPDEQLLQIERQFYFSGSYYPIDKYTYFYENGRTKQMEILGFDGSYWDHLATYDFQYSGDRLTEETWQYYDHGSLVPELKMTYEYNSSHLSTVTYFDFSYDWIVAAKEEAAYTEGKVSQVIYYEFQDSTFREDSKFNYHYAGKRLKNIGIYEFDGYNWDSAGAISFTYDSYGNLTSEYFLNGVESRKIEYEYEEGEGNYQQIILPGGGFLSLDPYPEPTKHFNGPLRVRERFNAAHFRLFTN
jgi:hypothetical protein